MKNSRFLAAALSLIAMISIGGCMSVSDPYVSRQTGSIERSVSQPPNVLLIFKVGLEKESYLANTPAKAEALYHIAGKAFVERVKALGGSADYRIDSDSTPLEIKISSHTHVLIQSISKISVDGYGNARGRVWNSSLFVLDTTSTKQQPRKIYSQVFASDGIRCFSGSQYANKAECQVKYMDHLVAQVAPLFSPK